MASNKTVFKMASCKCSRDPFLISKHSSFRQLLDVVGAPLLRTSSVPEHLTPPGSVMTTRPIPLVCLDVEDVGEEKKIDATSYRRFFPDDFQQTPLSQSSHSVSKPIVDIEKMELGKSCADVQKPRRSFCVDKPVDADVTKQRRSFCVDKPVGVDAMKPRRSFAIDIPVDENNVPQIDEAITPPAVESCRSQTRRFSSLRLPAGNLRPTRKELGKSQSVLIRKRVKSSNALTPLHHTRDYLSADPLQFGRGRQFQYIGDDISLYGTPREDLSPAKVSKAPSLSNFASANYLRDQISAMFHVSDNKLAMKLFGNKHALMKEKLRQKAVGNWVIHPCSNFR